MNTIEAGNNLLDTIAAGKSGAVAAEGVLFSWVVENDIAIIVVESELLRAMHDAVTVKTSVALAKRYRVDLARQIETAADWIIVSRPVSFRWTASNQFAPRKGAFPLEVG